MRAVMTWGELIGYAALVNGVYYTAVVGIFFRRELGGLFAKRGRESLSPSLSKRESGGASTETSSSEATIYNSVHELLEDCKQVFRAAVEESLEKSQILEALQVRLRKYPSVKGTSFQIAVTNHLEQELDNRCGLKFSESDIEQLWS